MEYLVFVNEYLHEMNLVTIIFRIVCAVVAGTIIGIDRSEKRRVAGYKTHAIVCLGAALVMLTGEYIFRQYGGSGDLARLGAQVISGVGFLGVGTIIVTGNNQVKGLTTAASLWTCSCIGLAIGIGFYSGALASVAALLLIFRYFKLINYYVNKHLRAVEVYIELESAQYISGFLEFIREKDCKVSSFEIGPARMKDEGISILATIETGRMRTCTDVLELLRSIPGIRTVEEYNC
ncbi:MgtC/SapB family protein [Anaerosacchariphilus polymeriproducens]|uniref:MgtC/SapB family protein n=1 Tax=Anaerosacchariphilus polymeriproducens TaxID=1812858 RepID=A0A371AQM3_9FIRM|nr:MgtC/SapB family protein [Anaerosacchariphilus polymeriproducens]RDU21760.1 MgtC/SapB family protein [Anaerosacchariphilus polymeriproducens]